FVELADIGILKRVLELATANAPAHGDVLRRLKRELDAFDLRKLWPEPVDDGACVSGPLVARLESDEEPAGICGLCASRAAHGGADRGDIGVLPQHFAELHHEPSHFLRRDILPGFGEACDQAGVLYREEALRNNDVEVHTERHGGEEHNERDQRVAQYDVERAPIEGEHFI